MKLIKVVAALFLGIILALACQNADALQIAPAPDGKPIAVAQKVIWDNFDKKVCPHVVKAQRLEDGSIKAKCSNRETFRIFVVVELNQPVAMRCSAVKGVGISGC